MNITLISVVTAIFIGGVEGIQILNQKLNLNFGLVDNIKFDNLGFFIIAVCVVSWLLSILIYKIKHYDFL